MEYFELFIESFLGVLQWTVRQFFFKVPISENYFWGLIIISSVVWTIELVFPWRKNQKIFRQDFWLDLFYMFFNFFIFSIIIVGFYKVFNKMMFDAFNISSNSISILNLSHFNPLIQLLIFFVILDFFQWTTHILMHKYTFLWKFHKVHHSVKEMGVFAMIILKGPIRNALMIASILSLILSWGKNFPIVTDFFIYNVPFYNKFRSV